VKLISVCLQELDVSKNLKSEAMSTTHWTLFLDRDGVINERLPGAYISQWSDFQFTNGAETAIAQFSAFFSRILIVTNQQGIGKGLMSIQQLEVIHGQMQSALLAKGGQIHGIYFCPDLKSKEGHCRKPSPAMALQAQKEFPEISFEHSVMVGDSISDIQFGQRLGMKTVLIDTKEDERAQWVSATQQGLKPDLVLPDLASFVAYLPTFLD